MNRQIEINIEELILHGFDRRDRHRIGQAVEKALVEMFTARGATPFLLQGGDVDVLQGGSFTMQPNSKPHATGEQIAHAVYTGLKGDK